MFEEAQHRQFLDDDESLNESLPDLMRADDESSDSSSTNASLDRLHPVRSLQAVEVPDFVEVLPEQPFVQPSPNVIQALHQSWTDIREQQISTADYYRHLRELSPAAISKAVSRRAHVDGGSVATTTHDLSFLFNYRVYSPEERKSIVRLKVADDAVYVPTGTGFLKIPCSHASGYIFLPCFYTPEIPATILSPDAAARRFKCRGYSTFSDIIDGTASMQLVDCVNCTGPIDFKLTCIRGLLYTEPMVRPDFADHLTFDVPDTIITTTDATMCDIRALSQDQQRALWHFRLGHVNERTVADLHKYVDGVPKMSRSDALHSCALCKRTKLHKAARGPSEDSNPTDCWQHIQIDFGFMVQKSKTKSKKSATKVSSESPPSDAPIRNVSRDTVRRSTRAGRFAGNYSSSETVVPPPPSRRSHVSREPYHSPPSPERYTFTKIVTHQGPISPSDAKRYKGCPFNLKILWSTGQTTWEPLSNIFEDNPDSVVEYAQAHNLLDNPHWSMVRDLALSPDYIPNDDDDHHEEFDFPSPPVDPSASIDIDDILPERYKRARGLNGETCYVLISDSKSGSIKVSIRRDKSPPFDFLKSFLANFKPNVGNCRVRFDGGGELGGNTEIHKLFETAGYTVEVTPPDSSSAIGQAERPHRTIADAVRTMLFAAGLPLSYWPFALQHYVLIHNALPHGDRQESAYTICTGKRFNLSLLRVFGCRIYALPTTKRDVKLDVHARPGIFLGYRNSLRNAIYLDDATRKVKKARHISFDEGMADLIDPPPFVKLLKNPDLKLDHIELDASPDLDVSLSPFTDVKDYTATFRPQDEHSLGLQFGRCARFTRATITAFTRPFGTLDVTAANRKLLGSYILKIGSHPVFSVDDVSRILHAYSHQPDPPATLVVRLAIDRKDSLADSRPASLTLRPVDIRRIAAMPLVAGEGTPIQQRAALREAASRALPSGTPADPDDLTHHSAPDLLEMRKLSNDHMTEEEKALPSFTRKRLMKLSNWPEWQAADDKQLNQHFDAGTIGMAIPRPPKDPLKPSQVFRLHWARVVKSSGVRKSRACLDGSKRAAPWLRMMVQTYSSCVELPCLRAFLAICATRGYYVSFGDVENAYQQSPPPSIDCFLEVDDTIYDWYLRRFGVKLDKTKEVIPLYRALQGHPEAGALWERMITDILINKMGFKNTAHEKNLYLGQIDGEEVLVCRQVDDFATGSKNQKTSEKFIDEIRKHVEAEFAYMGVKTESGYYQRYNGIDVFQTKDYIMVSAESYIDRMLATHGWDSPKHPDKVPEKAIPLNADAANRLMTLEGPPEKSIEAQEIARRQGFSYRNILGELIYAYVICRLDIGYAVCFLARFSDSPHEEHFTALKAVCKYLRATKSWGIIYKRLIPLEDLPYVPFTFLEQDPDLPPFPDLEHDGMAGFLDAAHATDLKTRRSVTGYVIFLALAAIAWKSRIQPLVATSSTEAEFYAAVTCAKVAKYLKYVLQELDAIRSGPIPLYIDNQAALAMINESRPTPRARHIEIQHFAIQEWRNAGDIIMKHIPGVINPSDDFTKPLGWALHGRHARRCMGHYK